MHALMGTIFLGRSGSDALVLDAQSHPPDIELGEAVDTAGGEGDSVVGADGVGEAKMAEGALEDGEGTAGFDIWQAATGQEETGVLIGDGEGEAPVTVTGVELAFEVSGPQVVGLLGMGWDRAGVLVRSFASLSGDFPFSL
jgi:hypothetical protein